MADLSLDIEITRAQNRNYALADGFHRMVRQAPSWSLFLRYQAQAERHYRRAVEEFDRLKALRAELPNEPIWEAQPEEDETTYVPPDEPISVAHCSSTEPRASASGPARMTTRLRTAQPARPVHRGPVAPKRCFRTNPRLRHIANLTLQPKSCSLN